MTFTNRAVIVLAALLTSSSAYAQVGAGVTLSAPEPSRLDVAAHLGWVGRNKSAIAPAWNRWYDAAAVDVSAGYYWTRHLKLELDGSTTSSGTIFVQEQVLLPGSPLPFYQSREHRFRSTALSAGLAYQFFDNRWFHPFLGAGLALAHETQRSGPGQPIFYPQGNAPPPLASFEDEQTEVRPFAATGFKVYVSERAFFRTDVRVTASREQLESVVWRGGVGFDF